jgi:hypothetical protein
MTANFKILFIDDNSIVEEVDEIRRALVKHNITIAPHVIDMKLPDFFKDNTKHGEVLSAEKIQQYLVDNGVMDIDFDIVACDFNFSDPFYDGYKLLISLINFSKDNNKAIRRSKFIFYTGDTNNLEQIAGSDLKRLLPLKVEQIVDRRNLSQEFIRFIHNTSNEVNLEKMFLSYLGGHHDKKFISTFPPFSGKSFADISAEIETGSANGKAFLECLVEQSISHLVDLQED